MSEKMSNVGVGDDRSMQTVSMSRTGGPDVLEITRRAIPEPGPGEVLIRHEAIGLNFIDTYQRTGLYPLKLPAVLGLEAAGVVQAVGEGVTRLSPGDRAAYCSVPGAYAGFNVVPESRAVRLPNGVSTRDAAAVMLKGLTAEFLARRIWPLEPGDAVVVYAAAGGVGSILCPWLRRLGVRVIGVVGHADKVELARGHGCADVLCLADGPTAAKVRDLTEGRGARVVYDSVGRDTFKESLAMVAKRGLLVSFGNASGPAPAVAPGRLSQAGSIFLTRPTLFDYIATTEALDEAAAALFAVLTSDVVKVNIGATYPLEQARAAHEALEARRTTGSTLLIP